MFLFRFKDKSKQIRSKEKMKHQIIVRHHEYIKYHYGDRTYTVLHDKTVNPGDILQVKECDNCGNPTGNILKMYISDVKPGGSMHTVSLRRLAAWQVMDGGMLACTLCSEDYSSGEEDRKSTIAFLKEGKAYPYCPHCGAMMLTEEEIKQMEKKDSERKDSIWA